MTFCQKCGTEIERAASSQKLCRECREKEREKKKKKNNGLSADMDKARAFKMSYGEYRQFADRIKKMK